MSTQLIGLGLGFRPQHYKIITETLPTVDWFEIITENFMGDAPRPRKFLEKLRSHYPIATHGVSLSITSLEPLDPDYLRTLARFISWLEPKLISDHLCWTNHKGRNSHDLLPTPYTRRNLENVITKVHQVQDVIKSQFVFENPSAYVAFNSNEMSEADFFSELVKKTGCGILLDINNAYVNWKNLGWDPISYFFGLPHESVKQFHLAGHSIQNGILIDTHDHSPSPCVIDLYKKALGIWPNVPTLLEWDEKIPEFNILMNELNNVRMAKATYEERSAITVNHCTDASPSTNLESIYGIFFETVTGSAQLPKGLLREDLPVLSQSGTEIYSHAYFLRLEGVLKDLFPTLAWIAEESFKDLIYQYLNTFPPRHYSINQIGQDMVKFLDSHILNADLGVEQSVLKDLAALDWAHVEVFEKTSNVKILKINDINSISITQWETIGFALIPRSKTIDLQWDIGPVWKSVDEGVDPSKPTREDCTYLVWGNNGVLKNQKISEKKKIFLNSLGVGKTFKESMGIAKFEPDEAAHMLAQCISDELITNPQPSLKPGAE